MRCPKCGNEMNDGAKFCKYCGNKIELQPPKKNKKKGSKYKIPICIGVICLLIIGVVGIFVTTKKIEANQLQQNLDLGQKYLASAEYDKAIVAFDKAISIAEKAPGEDNEIKVADAAIGKAEAYNGLGQPEESEKMLKVAYDTVKETNIATVKKNPEQWTTTLQNLNNANDRTIQIYQEQGNKEKEEVINNYYVDVDIVDHVSNAEIEISDSEITSTTENESTVNSEPTVNSGGSTSGSTTKQPTPTIEDEPDDEVIDDTEEVTPALEEDSDGESTEVPGEVTPSQEEEDSEVEVPEEPQEPQNGILDWDANYPELPGDVTQKYYVIYEDGTLADLQVVSVFDIEGDLGENYILWAGKNKPIELGDNSGLKNCDRYVLEDEEWVLLGEDYSQLCEDAESILTSNLQIREITITEDDSDTQTGAATNGEEIQPTPEPEEESQPTPEPEEEVVPEPEPEEEVVPEPEPEEEVVPEPEPEEEVVPEPEQEEEPQPEEPAVAGYTGTPAYDAIIQKYITAISEQWDRDTMSNSDICYLTSYTDSLSTMGYYTVDLNGDGVNELLIGASRADYQGMFYDLYTLTGDTATLVTRSGERDRYYLCENNMISNMGSGGAELSNWSFYQLAGPQLQCIESILYDGTYDAENPWFYGSGTDVVDYSTPIADTDAQGIINKYLVKTIPYTPLG